MAILRADSPKELLSKTVPGGEGRVLGWAGRPRGCGRGPKHRGPSDGRAIPLPLTDRSRSGIIQLYNRPRVRLFIGLLERDSVSPDRAEVEDLIAFTLTAPYSRPETHLGAGGLSERDRPLVPLFQRWLIAARNVKELAKSLQVAGVTVNGYDDLLRAMNRSKPVAESFEHFVELNGRLAKSQAVTNGG